MTGGTCESSKIPEGLSTRNGSMFGFVNALVNSVGVVEDVNPQLCGGAGGDECVWLRWKVDGLMFSAGVRLERKEILDVSLEFRVFLGWCVGRWWSMSGVLVRFP